MIGLREWLQLAPPLWGRRADGCLAALFVAGADDIQATCDKLGFEKLKILAAEPGKDENEGYVTFQVG